MSEMSTCEVEQPEQGRRRVPASCDVCIVGCGVSGLYAALKLPRSLRVTMLSKGPVEQCDSMLAQGGICVLDDASDYEAFFADTMAAGHWENRRESVDVMLRSSKAVIDDLVALGVDFEREADGSLAYTREGAHSRPRICYHADVTGREITQTLLARVRELPNVDIFENVEMVDIVEACTGGERRCAGVVCRETQPINAGNDEGPVTAVGPEFEVCAGAVLWATGGIGGTYARSTNYPLLMGDACRIAREHGVELEHMDYVQIHPTGLWSRRPGRTFLISESCRGEGAVLLDGKGQRFCDELQPRDVVTEAIRRKMREEGSEHVWLSFAAVDPQVICSHFANIRARCLEEGFDILREPIPVAPAQHYFMGGVHVRTQDSATTLRGLYAAGETSCNGVHGKNRLASNSLLESLVFAERAAYSMARELGCPASVPQLRGDVDPALVHEALEGTGRLAAPGSHEGSCLNKAAGAGEPKAPAAVELKARNRGMGKAAARSRKHSQEVA